MTIEVRDAVGNAAYTPVAGTDGDAGLQLRCQLDVENHNMIDPAHPWSLWIEQTTTDPTTGQSTTAMVKVFPQE